MRARRNSETKYLVFSSEEQESISEREKLTLTVNVSIDSIACEKKTWTNESKEPKQKKKFCFWSFISEEQEAELKREGERETDRK